MKRKRAASDDPSVSYCKTGQNSREILPACVVNSLYLNRPPLLITVQKGDECLPYSIINAGYLPFLHSSMPRSA
jgi:hypothetical protein